MPTELDEVHAQILSCTKCPLHLTRTHAVPGEGSFEAKVMFVGEGPGLFEDKQGRPFVGPAGKFLDELLKIAGLKREEVFITNVVKCHPVGNDLRQNRKPTSDEIAACKDYLVAQIALIKPKVICLLGDVAMKTLLDAKMKISEVHAQPFTKSGIVYVPLYHPAAALHQQRLKDVVREDMVKLRQILQKVLHEGAEATEA